MIARSPSSSLARRRPWLLASRLLEHRLRRGDGHVPRRQGRSTTQHVTRDEFQRELAELVGEQERSPTLLAEQRLRGRRQRRRDRRASSTATWLTQLDPPERRSTPSSSRSTSRCRRPTPAQATDDRREAVRRAPTSSPRSRRPADARRRQARRSRVDVHGRSPSEAQAYYDVDDRSCPSGKRVSHILVQHRGRGRTRSLAQLKRRRDVRRRRAARSRPTPARRAGRRSLGCLAAGRVRRPRSRRRPTTAPLDAVDRAGARRSSATTSSSSRHCGPRSWRATSRSRRALQQTRRARERVERAPAEARRYGSTRASARGARRTTSRRGKVTGRAAGDPSRATVSRDADDHDDRRAASG